MKKLLLLSILLIVGCWMDADLNGFNDASFHGDINSVKRLLIEGADVNGKGWDGDTPLANAIRGEHTEIIILLLMKGEDINNKFVMDAIYGSEKRHNKEIWNILCKYGNEYSCNLDGRSRW